MMDISYGFTGITAFLRSLMHAEAIGGAVTAACGRLPRHRAAWRRAFFEGLVIDKLDLGRPDTIKIIFDRQVRADTPRSSRPRSSPAAPRSPSTPSTSTPASSNT